MIGLEEWVSNIAGQVPGLIVLAWLTWHFFQHLHRVQKDHQEHYAELSLAVREAMERAARAHMEMAKELERSKRMDAKLAQIILYHDATVKGQNTEASGSPQELIEKILKSVQNGG